MQESADNLSDPTAQGPIPEGAPSVEPNVTGSQVFLAVVGGLVVVVLGVTAFYWVGRRLVGPDDHTSVYLLGYAICGLLELGAALIEYRNNGRVVAFWTWLDYPKLIWLVVSGGILFQFFPNRVPVSLPIVHLGVSLLAIGYVMFSRWSVVKTAFMKEMFGKGMPYSELPRTPKSEMALQGLWGIALAAVSSVLWLG